MTKYILTILISLISIYSFSQEKISVTGKVTDALNLPLIDSEITIGNKADSTKIATTTTDETGSFKIELERQENPIYIIVEDALEGVFKKSFESLKNSTDLGTIVINPMVYDLKEVVVTNAEAMVVKQDTIEYNADSYKVKPNANLEALLRELPGFEMDDDGKITVNGKDIGEILIDGEPFFGTDGKVAIENLPADIIKKIQVSDYKTKNEKFSGEKSKSNKSSLNITLKEDKKKGYMLKATGGYGTDNHYEANLMANYFKGKKKFSLIGSSTDIAASGLVNGEGSRGRGGMGRRGSNGITTNTSIGLNYNDQINDNLKIGANYRLNHSYNKNENYTRKENLNPNNIFTTTSNTKSNSETYGHNFGSSLEWTKKNTKLYFNPTFNTSSTTNSSVGDSESIDENGVLKNDTKSDIRSNGNTNTFSNLLSINQKLKNNSYIDFSSDISVGQTNNNQREISNATFYDGSRADRNRNVNSKNISKNNSYNFELKYTLPITDSIKIAVGSSYNITDSETNNSSLNYNEATGEFDNINTDLSRLFTTTQNKLNPYAQFLLNRSKLSASIKLGTNVYNQDNFGNYKGANYNLTQKEILPDLSGNIRYQKNNNSIMLMYSYNTSLASSSQVLPIEDNSSLTSITTGNPDLDPNKAHNINLMFGNFDRKTRQGFNVNLGYTYNESSIVNSVVTNNQDLTRRMTYENVAGNYRLQGNLNFSKQFQKGTNKLRVNVGLMSSYALNQGFNQSEKYKAFNTTIAPNVRLNWDYGDYLTISPSYRLNFTSSKYENYRIDGQDNITHNFGLKTISNFPKKLTWTNDFSYNYNSRMAAGFKRDFFLWNAQLMYRFFNDKLEAGVKVYDILNQNNSYSRTITEDAITDQRNNILGRFMMFSLTFNLNQFGGKSSGNKDSNNRSRGEMQQMNIQ
ncbi:TonB-dependent receptor [Empedobacter sedimenti]|uniref:TonB-dependent receptor n=1 Tax=Empedobacter sedimenti TaxID=3042610 RepID=UPI0024A6B733|nr:TonB-dependent receptor [Empedobacter sedimenti]